MGVVEPAPRGHDLLVRQAQIAPELRGSRCAPELDERSVGAPPNGEVEIVHARGQWRKWRRPVTTIAAPAASTAFATSSSRIEPPGWMSTRTPWSSASAGPSGNGKNASEA